MALTYVEKNRLDNDLRDFFEERIEIKDEKVVAKTISLVDLKNSFPTYKPSSLYASFKRINRISVKKDDKLYCARVSKMEKEIKLFPVKMFVSYSTHYKKEKNILHFECHPDLIYDFNTHKFNMNIEEFERYTYVFDSDTLKLLEYEWLFNYTDNLSTINNFIYTKNMDMLKTMPAGYYEYIQTKGFNVDSFDDFCNIKKYGKIGKFITGLHLDVDSETLEKIISLCPPDKLSKIIKNSIMLGDFSYIDRYNIQKVYSLIRDCLQRGYNPIIDSNRDLYYNLTLLKNLYDKDKNEKLAKQLQRLNFLNGLVFGDYIVVVPQNQEEKQDEGRQQNNCVGHYYDTSILNGKNLIYFVRKKDTPKKSYITCRYNTTSKTTCEYRKVNNDSVHDTVECELISKTITDIINKNLK